MQITMIKFYEPHERPKIDAVDAVMHNVKQLRRDAAEHTGESTGNLDVLQRRIEDQLRVLVGLTPIQPELPGLPPL